MKKGIILVLALALLVTALPVMAARVAETKPIYHDTQLVFQAYPGDSDYTNKIFKGLYGLDGDATEAVAGVFAFIPGKDWANFVTAYKAGITYEVKNVVLTKSVPYPSQCADKFNSGQTIVQQGTEKIRTWWPVMYELPGTVWTLTVSYGTPAAWKDPANSVATYFHTDIWKWKVVADLESIDKLLDLFHQLPFGTDQVPLISDEYLYEELEYDIDKVQDAYIDRNYYEAAQWLMEFEADVADRCITTAPSKPKPGGEGTGIANSNENPACCKLLTDAAFAGEYLGIWSDAK